MYECRNPPSLSREATQSPEILAEWMQETFSLKPPGVSNSLAGISLMQHPGYIVSQNSSLQRGIVSVCSFGE